MLELRSSLINPLVNLRTTLLQLKEILCSFNPITEDHVVTELFAKDSPIETWILGVVQKALVESFDSVTSFVDCATETL